MELHCLQVAGPITEEAEKWGVCNRAVHGVLVDKDMKYEARIILGTLSKDVFERSTSTGSVAFSLLICLDANKLVLLSFCSLLKRFTREFQPNRSPMMQKVHFRLTSVAQKRCCLSSLL